jgi:aldose 1-epimerase
MAALILEAPDARLTVLPDDGGRIGSLVVHGSELLVTEGLGPVAWGSYPMAPFAGRIRRGRFRFDGRDVQLPINFGPHAIHGTVFDRPWTVVDETSLTIDLGADWPFRGRVAERFSLTPGELTVTLTVDADERMPAAVGWHPWFRRWLVGTTAMPEPRSKPVELAFDAAWMYQRDADGMPTGECVPPPPGPWDDCFTGIRSNPRLVWPGRLGLELSSSCDHWVVYDQRDYAVCVEPQTAPPDFVNLPDPAIIEPGRPLVARMTLRWWPLADE